MDISIEEFRDNMREMKDFSFTASTGVRVKMDLSLLRSMSEEERIAARQKTQRLFDELRIKYARQIAAAKPV